MVWSHGWKEGKNEYIPIFEINFMENPHGI
jgi:hypothetical protein